MQIRIPKILSVQVAAIALLLLAGCSKPSEAPAIQGDKPFFDLKIYFQSEIERLGSEQTVVDKIINLGGVEETQTMQNLDFGKELNLFLQADINRPAWVEKYQIDSSFSVDDLENITYTALDSSLIVRTLSIDFHDNKVQQVNIRKKEGSFIAFSKQQLSYQPSKGYLIQSHQEVILSKPKEIRIDATFAH